jgi:glycosyltransferase involved in cell wall biosynthesis
VATSVPLRSRVLRALLHPVLTLRVLLWRARKGPARLLEAAVRSPAVPLPTARPAQRSEPRTGRTYARVLHVVTNALPYSQAGYTIRTHAVVTAQRAAGLDPQVVTRWGWPVLQGVVDPRRRVLLDGIAYHRLPPRGAIPVDGAAQLQRQADDLTELVHVLRPAVVHCATPHLNGTPALAAARRTGLPLVYEVRGFLEQTWAANDEKRLASERYCAERAAETALMRRADAVVTLAETMRAEIVARGVDPQRVIVVPNAVDAALLDASPDGAGYRRRLGIGPHEYVVGSVSSITAYEGFDTLLRAAAMLPDLGAPARVLLVGDGPELRNLRELAALLGLSGSVVLPGRVPPAVARDAVDALDVLCVPRIDAPVCRTVTPLKPVEAMALGVPVVASDLPALSRPATRHSSPKSLPGNAIGTATSSSPSPGRRWRAGAPGRQPPSATASSTRRCDAPMDSDCPCSGHNVVRVR